MGEDYLDRQYLLVLPGGVKLLPLREHVGDLLLDLGGGRVVLPDHGLAQGDHLAERLLPRLNLRLEIVVLRLQHLGRGRIGHLPGLPFKVQ